LALAGLATAVALETARKRKEEEARVRAEMERKNAEAEAAETAHAAAVAAAKAEAEFKLTMGQIVNQATGGQGPSNAWMLGAAAAAEAARRKAKGKEDESPRPPLPEWKEEILEPKLPPLLDLAKVTQDDYAAGDVCRHHQAEDQEDTEEPPPPTVETLTLAQKIGMAATGLAMVVGFTAAEASLVLLGIEAASLGPVGVAFDVLVVVPLELFLIDVEVAVAVSIYRSIMTGTKQPVRLAPPWGLDKGG